MRSRYVLEWAGLALGAAVQGVWCGVLAATLSGADWPELAGFAAVAILLAAAVSRWAGRDERRLRRGRVLLVGVVLVAACVLLVGGRAWTHDYVAWRAARDVVFAGILGVLGVYLGRDRQAPEDAVRRAIRAFGVLCGVLVCAALAGHPVPSATAAVAAALVAGGLHIAVVRYRVLTDLVADGDRLPPGPWFAAVVGAIAAVVAVAALVGILLDADVLHWLLLTALAGLRYVAAGVGYLLGWAGAGLLRALNWLTGLFGLHVPQMDPPEQTLTAEVPQRARTVTQTSSTTRTVTTVLVTAAVTAGSLAVVVLALRRLRREGRDAVTVSEERESVRAVSSVVGSAMGRVVTRLRGLVRRARHPATPAEAIRLRYRRLEERLTESVAPRAAGTTVREYLCACVGGMGSYPTAAATDVVTRAAADLADLYELARYSAHAVSDAEARRFEDLARSFGVQGS